MKKSDRYLIALVTIPAGVESVVVPIEAVSTSWLEWLAESPECE